MTIYVNEERLRTDLENLATIGRDPDGGISRPAFSLADIAARKWFVNRARESGIPAHIDGALNVLIGQPRSRPDIWTGSHLDTVPRGGMFDGALGSVAALECVRCIREAQLPLNRNVGAVAFSDEEGTHHSFLGSKYLLGHLDDADLHDYRDSDGQSLADIVSAAGIAPGSTAGLADWNPHRFVELHIEQGPVLENLGADIGIVTSITGVAQATVCFYGQADHAGTTPMHLRRDALSGAARFIDKARDLPSEVGRADAVVTCGQINVTPGASNVVPALASVTVDFRDSSEAGMKILQEALDATSLACADSFNLDRSFSLDDTSSPAHMDSKVANLIDEQAKRLNLSTHHMVSGAGHDSQIISTQTPTSMIFVPSINGRSHSPLENTAWDDVINGANVLLRTLVALAT